MITDRQLLGIADAVDATMGEAPGAAPDTGWAHVEWLRLKADLLSRLAAAERRSGGELAWRAELIRDEAERTADELAGLTATVHPLPARTLQAVSAEHGPDAWQQACQDAVDQVIPFGAGSAVPPQGDGHPRP